MNFLPDVYVHCETCQGKRFNRETLELDIKVKASRCFGMSIEDALTFFEHVPKIHLKLYTSECWLSYVGLGQLLPH